MRARCTSGRCPDAVGIIRCACATTARRSCSGRPTQRQVSSRRRAYVGDRSHLGFRMVLHLQLISVCRFCVIHPIISYFGIKCAHLFSIHFDKKNIFRCLFSKFGVSLHYRNVFFLFIREEMLMQSGHNRKALLSHQKHQSSSSAGEKQLSARQGAGGASAIMGQLPNEEQDVLARKYGEVILNTISTVAAALEYPKGVNNSTLMLEGVQLNSIFLSICRRPHQGLGASLLLGARHRVARLCRLQAALRHGRGTDGGRIAQPSQPPAAGHLQSDATPLPRVRTGRVQ